MRVARVRGRVLGYVYTATPTKEPDMNAPATTCRKCGGTGRIDSFSTIDGGRCWSCKGFGCTGTAEQRDALKARKAAEAEAADADRAFSRTMFIVDTLETKSYRGESLPPSTAAVVDELVAGNFITPQLAGQIRACIQ